MKNIILTGDRPTDRSIVKEWETLLRKANQ